MPEERLQKILSRAGVASRRKAEELILAGAVMVNGKTVTALGSKADPLRDAIKVGGKLIRLPRQFTYLVLNKPRGYITTRHDPEGRPTVMELLGGIRERVYPVGRLDYDSEGLLLLTNDGEFANRILHAKNQVPKTYLVKVNRRLSQEQERQFREGIPIGGRRTAPAGLKLVQARENPWYEVRLIEGRRNQIKWMFLHFGVLVEKIKRVKIGFLELGELAPGQFRRLTDAEVARFRQLLRLEPVAKR